MTHDRRPTDLLSLPEAAEALGLSASTLRTQREKGAILATKIGRDWLISWGEVERYRAQSRGRHQGPAPGSDRTRHG